jgi:hypothetical protein
MSQQPTETNDLQIVRWILAAITAVALGRALAGLIAGATNSGVNVMSMWMTASLGLFAALELRYSPHWAAIVGTCAAGYADSLLNAAEWNAGGSVGALSAPTLWLVALDHPAPLESPAGAIAARAVTGFAIAHGFMVYSGFPLSDLHWLITAPLGVAAIGLMYLRCRRVGRPLASLRGRLILLSVLPLALGILAEVVLVTTGVLAEESLGSAVTTPANLIFSAGILLILTADVRRRVRA